MDDVVLNKAATIEKGQLDAELAEKLKRMVGFRNVAVHDYQTLNLTIVEAIVKEHLGELLAFSEWAVRERG